MKSEYCKECGKYLENKRNIFCDRRCAAYYNNRNSEKLKNCKKGPEPKNQRYHQCQYCNKTLIKNSINKYCDKICFQNHRYQKFIDNWLSGKDSGIRAGGCTCNFIRTWLIKKFGNKCSICNWAEVNITTGNVPVQLDHIDGNWKNNNPNNLRLLCPNCHSLTSTWCSLNIGNGRWSNFYKDIKRKNYE